MRLYTSASDKKFFVALVFSASALAAAFYYLAESFSETMLMEKDNWRLESLKIAAGKSDFVLLGTSHAEGHLMPVGAHYIKLTGGHNLPPAMYYETKALLKYSTSVKVAYIEADDHVFMNGPAYDIKKSDEKDMVESAMYGAYQNYFDEEGKSIFGSKGEKESSIKLLALQENIKPILLKRIANRVFRHIFSEKKEVLVIADTGACENLSDIAEPNITSETYWSRLQGAERDGRLHGRISGFSLDKPSALSPLMTEYYEKTIRLFFDNGIRVVLVRYPMSYDFQGGVHPENTATINRYIEGLRQKYNLDMLDISYLTKYGDKFFENEDHISKDFYPYVGAIILEDFCKKRLELTK